MAVLFLSPAPVTEADLVPLAAGSAPPVSRRAPRLRETFEAPLSPAAEQGPASTEAAPHDKSLAGMNPATGAGNDLPGVANNTDRQDRSIDFLAAAKAHAADGAPAHPQIGGAVFAPTPPMLQPPHKGPPTLSLRRDGTYRGDDLVFDATIDQEGRMTLRDKPNVQAHIALPTAKSVGEHLAEWIKDPYSIAIDERSVETHTVPLIGGSFDATDAAMRALGVDPYFARKKDYFERTHAFRLKLRAAATASQLRRVPELVVDNLASVWNLDLPFAERRRLVFLLWDECAETGADALVRAGRTARALIEGFVRSKIPEHSAAAYSAAEQSALNELRTSKQVFAPYAVPNESAILPP